MDIQPYRPLPLGVVYARKAFYRLHSTGFHLEKTVVPNCLSLASREVAPSRLGDRPSRQPLFLRPRLCRMHACSLCSTQPRDNHMWVPTRSEQPKHAMRVRLSQSCPTGTSSLVCSSVSFFDRSHFIHSFSTACAPVNNGRLLFSNYTNTRK